MKEHFDELQNIWYCTNINLTFMPIETNNFPDYPNYPDWKKYNFNEKNFIFMLGDI